MKPVLILNPLTDRRFTDTARAALARGVSAPRQLQSLLREEYPRAVVRARELSGERDEVWYVYRDGRWVASLTGGLPVAAARTHAAARDERRERHRTSLPAGEANRSAHR